MRVNVELIGLHDFYAEADCRKQHASVNLCLPFHGSTSPSSCSIQILKGLLNKLNTGSIVTRDA
jgi:hypothetical protein